MDNYKHPVTKQDFIEFINKHYGMPTSALRKWNIERLRKFYSEHQLDEQSFKTSG